MSTVAVASLLDAIEQQINLGEHEPGAIYERICRLYGDEWVREEAAVRGEPLDDVITRLVGWPDSTTVWLAGRYVSLGVLRDMAAILRHVQDSRKP